MTTLADLRNFLTVILHPVHDQKLDDILRHLSHLTTSQERIMSKLDDLQAGVTALQNATDMLISTANSINDQLKLLQQQGSTGIDPAALDPIIQQLSGETAKVQQDLVSLGVSAQPAPVPAPTADPVPVPTADPAPSATADPAALSPRSRRG